jgi:uncharacterized NAD(P)/FAD-binding protein YdhS
VEQIVIVGGGASGVLMAAQLLRNPSLRNRTVTLIDRRATLGAGSAFGTRRPCHRLNVAASRMSGFADEPDHFVDWVQERDPSVGPTSFVSRGFYGEYLRDVLRQADGATLGARLCPMNGEVEAIELADGERATVRLRSGARIAADAVVLALGNLQPCDPHVGDDRFYESRRYIRDPWAPGAIEAISGSAPVLLIGSGLTAVDVVLTLESRRHRGAIHAISRHGALPQSHTSERPRVRREIDIKSIAAARTARELLHAFRTELRAADASGDDWRTVVDALRPTTQAIWRSLPEAEQRRFVAHLSRYWEVHRHRMAPQVAGTIDALRDRGALHVAAGRVVAYAESGDGVCVTVRSRDGKVSQLRVGHVVNCTGPGYDVVGANEPLIASLFRAGAVRPGPLGLGLDVDDRGAVINDAGVPSSRLWTLGALRRGALWESTAVPEIREQAAELATVLLR